MDDWRENLYVDWLNGNPSDARISIHVLGRKRLVYLLDWSHCNEGDNVIQDDYARFSTFIVSTVAHGD